MKNNRTKVIPEIIVIVGSLPVNSAYDLTIPSMDCNNNRESNNRCNSQLRTSDEGYILLLNETVGRETTVAREFVLCYNKKATNRDN